jgi:DNA-binding GntR family transcriptional regulator
MICLVSIMRGGSHYKIWQSINRNDTHYRELCLIHSEIVESIEKKDIELAIRAMQKHFVRVLVHYIQQLKPKPPGTKGKSS